MKGVILGLQPRAQIVDTIHLAVIDPGVGSRRRAIAVQTVNYLFVGPDNGVLSLALAGEKIKAIHQVTNAQLFLHPVSNTFHGRDVFAPVAAYLSKGLPLGKVGPPTKGFVKLSWPELQRTTNSIQGEIAYIDRFGNAITNIGNATLSSLAEGPCEIIFRGKRFCALQSFYQAVPHGKRTAVPGSSGLLELAVNGGSIARKFKLRVGESVIVRYNRRR